MIGAPQFPPLPPNPEQTRWFASEVLPHEPSLRAYLHRIAPGFSDVDDLMQECYLRILRARDRGAIGSVRGLLFAIARNAARDLFRRRTVADTIPLEDTVPSHVLDDAPGVAEVVSLRQETELLTEAIAALPERCRAVLTLRKFQGLSQKEIAARLGIAEHTVEIHLLNALRRCGKYFAERGMRPRAAR